ncbi:hypothetical protein QAD02_010390 [Eretmocerus hayati]|uniref:Uncharacterized protein n=1 Tax=Eretmocerus hayati TaxID=131215 RepID=A0ACC2NEP2_9HYME|nr:hypothetical protein QAD02_010390 [Eretmocerus hayati]
MALSLHCTRVFRRANNIIGKYVPVVLEHSSHTSRGETRQSLSFHNSCIQRGGKNEEKPEDQKIMKSPPCLRDELICPVAESVQDGLDKVSIIGAGMVGIACANAILFQKISSHVALVDAFPKKLKGEGHDYMHALTFLDDAHIEFDTDFCVTTNSRVIVIATGVRQTKDESRLDLAQKNADLIKNIIQPLSEYSPRAVFVVATNPVDVLTWLTWKQSGLPVNRVIGTGTHLDSARFRSCIAQKLGIASQSVQALVIGEHGDSQVPLWSGISVAGVQFRDVRSNIGMETDEERWIDMAKDISSAGSMVRCLKGYSNTAIGLTVADIVKDILRNAHSIKPVSTLVQGHHDVCDEVFLSLPCCIAEQGICGVVRMRITETEKKMFKESADQILKVLKSIKL